MGSENGQLYSITLCKLGNSAFIVGVGVIFYSCSTDLESYLIPPSVFPLYSPQSVTRVNT